MYSLTSEDFIIREIEPKDNPALAVVVREVIIEMGAPTTGTAYEDKATDQMYETYQNDRTKYFVLVHNDKVVGGGGIAPLEGADSTICELQKMYFLPIARGKGLGSKMIDKCLSFAKQAGFTTCYLETLPYMQAARSLYAKYGFSYIDGPMGNTGHYSCDVWMTKAL